MSLETTLISRNVTFAAAALALGIAWSAPTYAKPLKIAVLLPGPTSDGAITLMEDGPPMLETAIAGRGDCRRKRFGCKSS